MVSPQRVKEKLNRFHAKMMAHEARLVSGNNPTHRDVLGIAESRLGEEMNDLERARTIIAQHDLYTDVLRNLDKTGLSYKDYLADLKRRGINDYPVVLERIRKEIEEAKK